MKECPDEGRLQGFFDGELPVDMMEETARHIAACATCARAARELESENAILLRALEPEMSVSVPTEQLRTRIAEAVAQMNLPARSPVRESVSGRSSWWSSLSVLFRLTPLRATAFASILAVVILGSIFAVNWRTSRKTNTPSETPVVKVAPRGAGDDVAAANPVPLPTSIPITSTGANPGARPNRARTVDNLSSADRVAGVKLIPGEKSYLKTIAALDVNLKDGRRAMTPATRAEYERNLKLVDYAIAATRSKAKRTPHDPDAAEFMFAAYQSKIDLLSTMTEQARLTQH